jgi:hypothetical protein
MILGPPGFGDPELAVLSLRGEGTAPLPPPAGGVDDRDFDSKKLIEADTDADRGMVGADPRGGVDTVAAAEGRLPDGAGLSLIFLSDVAR